MIKDESDKANVAAKEAATKAAVLQPQLSRGT